MPSEQFLGINSSMALGMAVAIVFIALCTWLIAPEIAVATLLAILITSI